jgi:hypothetical protein
MEWTIITIKTHGNDNYYKPQYQSSYKPDYYKPDYQSYGKDRDKSKDSKVDIKKINCNNINLNFNNGQGGNGNTTNGDSTNGNETNHGSKKFNKDGFVCINNNNNIVIGGVGDNQITPPEPEPTTLATLTVNKEIFGCNNFIIGNDVMNCSQMTNTDSAWLPCTDPTISNSPPCMELPVNLFDIEVLDDQNSLIILPFEGSAQGTTIENLQPGTYEVNEIKNLPNSNINQLGESLNDETICGNLGFDDGGTLLNTTADPVILYTICIEYEDEQGNDCSTLWL